MKLKKVKFIKKYQKILVLSCASELKVSKFDLILNYEIKVLSSKYWIYFLWKQKKIFVLF